MKDVCVAGREKQESSKHKQGVTVGAGLRRACHHSVSVLVAAEILMMLSIFMPGTVACLRNLVETATLRKLAKTAKPPHDPKMPGRANYHKQMTTSKFNFVLLFASKNVMICGTRNWLWLPSSDGKRSPVRARAAYMQHLAGPVPVQYIVINHTW